jgi:hypothetical protein
MHLLSLLDQLVLQLLKQHLLRLLRLLRLSHLLVQLQ